MNLAVLIPAHNEAGLLPVHLREVRSNFPTATVVVVNSGSTDATGSVARDLGAVVVEQGCSGYAGALATGYRACLDLGVDTVLQLDADSQHPPEHGQELLDSLKDADWVIGSRTGTDSPSPLPRRAARHLLGVAVRTMTDQSLTDVTSGYWALNRFALSTFAEHFPQDVADANIRVLGDRLGLRIREVPVRMGKRRQGHSMHDGIQGARNFARSLRALHRAAFHTAA